MSKIIKVVTIMIRIKLRFFWVSRKLADKKIDPTPEEIRLENLLGFIEIIILRGTEQ
jgi:hypothetical protein